jgi:hypothetical protein
MKALSREGKFIVACLAAAVVLIGVTALLTPDAVVRDATPTTFNTGERGIKAAYLALNRMGYETARWEKPAADLAAEDAAHTALVITAPQYNLIANEQAGVRDFARRGGWVLAAGSVAAGMLLPETKGLEVSSDACDAQPEGLSAVARVQHLHFEHTFKWKTLPAGLEFAQSCGDRAAVLLKPIGKGMVVLWSESAPMNNASLKKNENLELLLASLPASHHKVLFDEYLHDVRDDLWTRTKGTPLLALKLQLVLLAGAILFSYSRRHGALRELASTPRTSPLEFSHSMGSVYHRGGAGEAAVEQARRRLMDFLERQCGFNKEMLEAGPSNIVELLAERFNYTNPRLEVLLEPATDRIKPADALKQVQALYSAQTEIALIVNKLHSTAEKDPRV